MLAKFANRLRRHGRVRAKVSGTASRPRLAIYRSNVNIYAQLIDDENSKTLGSTSDIKVTSGTKTEKAKKVWEEIAALAKKLKIETVVFDKWWFAYHGRVKALADSAREAGLAF